MEFRKRIESSENNISALKNNIEEQRKDIRNVTEASNKIATRLETVKEILSQNICLERDAQVARLEKLNQFCLKTMNDIKTTQVDDRNSILSSLDLVKTDL